MFLNDKSYSTCAASDHKSPKAEDCTRGAYLSPPFPLPLPEGSVFPAEFELQAKFSDQDGQWQHSEAEYAHGAGARRIVVIAEQPDSLKAQRYTGRFVTEQLLPSVGRDRTSWQIACQPALSMPEGLRQVVRRVPRNRLTELPHLSYGYRSILADNFCTLRELVVMFCVGNIAGLGHSAQARFMCTEEYAARLCTYQMRDLHLTKVSTEFALLVVRASLRTEQQIETAAVRANVLRREAYIRSLAQMRARLLELVHLRQEHLFIRIDRLFVEVFSLILPGSALDSGRSYS